MKQKWFWIIGLIAIAAALGAIFFLDRIQAPGKQASSSGVGLEGYEGDLTPSFTVKQIDGTPISLSDYKGKVVLVDFWATWCPPCVESIPHLNEIATSYGPKGIAVIGLTVDRDLEPVPKFIKDHEIGYPIGVATPAEIELFGGVSGIPTLIIIDRKQRVVAKLVGYQEPAVLKSLIDPLL